MLGVGTRFPAFSVQATVSTEKGKAFQTVTDQDYKEQWKLYFFWPKDFTFVCPTEIAAFGKLNREFRDRDTQTARVARRRTDMRGRPVAREQAQRPRAGRQRHAPMPPASRGERFAAACFRSA